MFFLFCFYQTEGKPSGSTSLLTTLTTQTTAAPFLSSLHTSNNGSFPVKSSLVQAVQPSAVQVNGNVT